MCSVGKNICSLGNRTVQNKVRTYATYTSIDACIAVGVVLLLVLALLSTQTANYESMLVSLLFLVLALQPILILVAASVRESTLVLRQILIREFKSIWVRVLVSVLVDVLSSVLVQIPVIAIEPIFVQGLVSELAIVLVLLVVLVRLPLFVWPLALALAWLCTCITAGTGTSTGTCIGFGARTCTGITGAGIRAHIGACLGSNTGMGVVLAPKSVQTC